ncbi:hypothetical protein AGDE_03575 [Angomonas deanei]|nr:hypothetical protein AGDE_03575 [Angomonas deanei]|eukprot:EPY40353.1 hypothetical protein AGDE_03575 [Angomonas deanei]
MPPVVENPNKEAEIDLLENDPVFMALFYRHVAHCPPHGPFRSYSAITLVERARREKHTFLSNNNNNEEKDFSYLNCANVLTMMERYYNMKHLAAWPIFYVPCRITSSDVTAYMAKQKE